MDFGCREMAVCAPCVKNSVALWNLLLFYDGSANAWRRWHDNFPTNLTGSMLMFLISATTLRNSLTAFAVLALMSLPLAAGDWPNWMGPRLDGNSSEAGWSEKWPEDGLPQVWTAELGIGFSSVSVVDGLLYSMGHSDGKESVWCLKASTGDKVWSHSYAAELNPNLYEGGPGSTPTVDGDALYTLSVDGRLLCLDRKDGNVRWERNLQQEFDVGLPEWGFNSSPLILADTVLIQGGRVGAFHRDSGAKIWQSEKHTPGYGSIRELKHDGKTFLASLDSDGVRICDATDGSQVAFEPWKSPFRTNSTTPIIVSDSIYISSGYNVGCGLFQFDGRQLTQIYANRHMRNHFSNSILFDGYLYGMDGNSNLGRVVTLTCMKYDTGEVIWKQRGLGCGSLMIADGKLLIQSETGDLVLAQATPEGYHEMARTTFLSDRCWTMPVLANGRVYGRNAQGKLVCVKLPAVD